MLENNGLAINRLNALGAALNLSFIGSEELNSRVTFTRASGATRFNKSGLLEVVGNDVARFDYDPTNVLAQNLSGYSEQPWLAILNGGLGVTTSLVGQGTDGQGGYADFRIFGTASGTGYPYIRLVSSSTSLTPGQQIIGRCSIEVLSGASPKALVLNLQELNSSSSFVANIANATIPQVGTNFLTVSGTATNPLCARVNYIITSTFLSGDIVNITLRIRKPQANYGLTLLPYVPTTSAPFTECAPKGLLIEESRTNSVAYSGTIYDANWITSGAVSVSAAGISPDGEASATVTFTGSGSRYRSSTPTVTTLAPWTTSMYVKYVSGNVNISIIVMGQSAFGGVGGDRLVTINASTGAFVSSSAEVGSNYTITNAGNGWWRVSGTCTPTTAGVTTNVGINGASAGVYLVWGAQVEQGAFPTSYIPTTTAAVTRAADSAVMTGANFSSWYNQTQGTFVADYDRFGFDAVGGSLAIVQADDGTINNRLALRVTPRSAIAGAQGTIVVGGVVGANNSQTGVNLQGVTRKSAIAYLIGAGSITSNGSVPVALTSVASLPAVTQLGIGQAIGGGAVVLNGHIRSIQYYNTKLTDAQLQALTT